MYETAINHISFNAENNWVISTCAKSMKIWDCETGKPVTAVEPPKRINDAVILPDTGVAFLALEQEKMQTYFIPTLGPAPRWCSFLDNLTEEMEENKNDTLYDDYKFLTVDELKSLSLSDLIGTNLLRAYMHGYFIDNRLYQKAKAAADPFAFETYKQEKIDQVARKEAKRAPVKKVDVAVNKDLYIKDNEGKGNLVTDPRFKEMFENQAFTIDDQSERAKLLKPVSSMKKVSQRRLEDESDEEQESEEILRPDLFEQEKQTNENSEDESNDESEDERQQEEKNKRRKKVTKKMEIRSGLDFTSLHGGPSREALIKRRNIEQHQSIGDRVNTTTHNEVTHVKGGRVFTLEKKRNTKETDLKTKNKKHMNERRKTTRNAESLMKKQRPSGFKRK